MIPDALQLDMRRLRAEYWLAAAGIGLFLVVGLIVADGDGIPAWVALPPVLAVGVIILFSVRYWRRRPIMPGNFAEYAKTARFRAGLSLLPAAAGLLMTVLSGEWWIAAVGAVIGFASLAVAPASDADYQRHVNLFVVVGEMPAEEKWGEAKPDEVAPWDDEHGDHGHGMSHSH